ncbi:hypothetical protein DFH06DRAFT_1335726 [Mycena polygramma]|nr:hypothetical protein DFH06DRAFT_1335726 [Mycena polygramma]
MAPVLPSELEREVLEKSALLHPETIPALLRVARRVFIWQVSRLDFFPDLNETQGRRRARAIINAAKSKNDAATFFHKAALEEITQVLRLCTEAINLAIYDPKFDFELLELVSEMRLRRLAIDLANVFKDRPITLTHPLFSSVTHLDVCDNITTESAQVLSDLAMLPALTHLCFNHIVPSEIMTMELTTCPRLRVLVNSFSTYFQPLAQEVAENPPSNDSRFVVLCVGNYSADLDFWARADMFVAKKAEARSQPPPFLSTHSTR